MKYYSLSVLLVLSSSLWSQKSASLLEQVASSKYGYWNLERYLWGYTPSGTRSQGKHTIDFEAIDNWPSLGSELEMSRDGKYFAYIIEYKGEFEKLSNEPDSLIVKSTSSVWQYAIENGKPGFFSADSKHYIYENGEDLGLVKLGTNEKKIVKNIAGYKRDESATWLAWQLKDADETVVLQNLVTGKESTYKRVRSYGFDRSGNWFYCQLASPGNELKIFNLRDGEQQGFSNVASFIFSGSGNKLLLRTTNNFIEIIDLAAARSETIWSAPDNQSRIINFVFDNSSEQILFLVQKATDNSIWYWKKGMESAVMKVDDQSAGVDKELRIGEGASFSNNGRYIQFNLYLKPDLRKPDPNASELDVWSYKDTILQSTRFTQSKQPKSYKAIVNPATGYIVQLEREENTSLYLITGDYAVLVKSAGGDRFWEKKYTRDSNRVVSLLDGSYRLLPVRSKLTNKIVSSPNGRYLIYFDAENGCNYFSYELLTGKLINLTGHLPAFQFGYRTPYLQTTKKPDGPASGSMVAAWIGGESLLVYDNYDLWQLDPSGEEAAINITQGYGTKNHMRFWIGDEICQFNKYDTLLLNAFNEETKYRGFYRKILGTSANPEELYMGPCAIKTILCDKGLTGKITSGSTWIVQKETATESPNYFLSNDLKKFQQISFIAPQKKYTLFTTELHHFKQLDGTMGQGILYKPENFDPKKKYPVIISFYGPGETDHIYEYKKPLFTIDPTVFDRPAWIVNQGYLLFVPDVYFTQNLWGASTINSVDGAARYLSSLPYVNGKHIGATGHSNSGRYGYYLFTHSHSFAAMSIGAGIANLLSYSLMLLNGPRLEQEEVLAYGAGGLGNLWDNKTRWLDHTAILQADKATSPLLMFDNKNDKGYHNAAQMYISLLRLDKKAWWLQYDLGEHVLSQPKDQRDFTIRFTQFFDHYLKDAPAPRWMTQGIPASLKTIEARYELDPSGSCDLGDKKQCPICKAWNVQYKRTPEMFNKPIAEWKLDSDIEKRMQKEETEKYNDKMKGEAQRIKENNAKLKAVSK